MLVTLGAQRVKLKTTAVHCDSLDSFFGQFLSTEMIISMSLTGLSEEANSLKICTS